LIEEQRGTVSQVQEWGARELAYPVHKQRRAIYVLFEYRASADGLREIERNVKLMDSVLRFISVRQDEDAPPAPFRPARGAEPEEPEADEGGLELQGAGDGEGA
jgi:small subunit ribosomal protein S6